MGLARCVTRNAHAEGSSARSLNGSGRWYPSGCNSPAGLLEVSPNMNAAPKVAIISFEVAPKPRCGCGSRL
jgi:hypothetical protein